MRLSGKIALVTGAGLGIGRGCAVELARAGADLVINDRPDSPDLESVADEIRGLGRKCTTIEANVFERAGCEELAKKAIAESGQIDIFISNPAFGKRGGFTEFDPDDFDRVIDATFKAGFHMSQFVARHMVERGGGKIVFISSVQAEMQFARNLPYGASKAAVNHMAQTIAVELSSHRINVNVIEPGWIDTPNERKTFSADVIAEEGRNLPWGRMGTPTDIGKAAVFLSSEDADYITGVILPVDGLFRFKDLGADSQQQETDAV